MTIAFLCKISKKIIFATLLNQHISTGLKRYFIVTELLRYITVVLMAGLMVFLTSSTEPLTKNSDLMEIRGVQFHKGMYRGFDQKKNCRMFSTLSEEQKDQMEKLRVEQIKKSLPLRNEINEKMAELQTLTTGDNIDLKKAKKVLATIEYLKTEMAKQKVEHLQAVRLVLNEEQKVMFDAGRSMSGKKGFPGMKQGMNGKLCSGKAIQGKGQPMMKGQPGMKHGMKGCNEQGMRAGMQKGRAMNGKTGMKGAPGNMQGNPIARMMDITEDQQAQFKTMRLEQMKEMTQLKNMFDEYKAKLKTLTTVDDVNMKDVNKVIDSMGEVKLEMAKKKLDHRMDIRALLNDEQKILFDMCNSRGMSGKMML